MSIDGSRGQGSYQTGQGEICRSLQNLHKVSRWISSPEDRQNNLDHFSCDSSRHISSLHGVGWLPAEPARFTRCHVSQKPFTCIENTQNIKLFGGYIKGEDTERQISLAEAMARVGADTCSSTAPSFVARPRGPCRAKAFLMQTLKLNGGRSL